MSQPHYLMPGHADSALHALLADIRFVAFDFDGVFTDNTVLVSEQGIESVRCWRSDGLGLARIKAIGITPLIISTEVNPVVSMRAKKLKLECLQGIEDKAASLTDWLAKSGIPLAQAAFVGNDINDIPAFRIVRFPIAVADAYPEVLPHVAYRTLAPGGRGAVREVCDLLFHARKGA